MLNVNIWNNKGKKQGTEKGVFTFRCKNSVCVLVLLEHSGKVRFERRLNKVRQGSIGI